MTTTAQEIALMKKDIETLREDVKEINDKLDRLMVKLLDPDEGLVVRVNKNTSRLDKRDVELPMWLGSLEQFKQMQRWKSNVTRALWGIYTAIVGYIIKLIFW
jgi:predicted nuclease with TOPRIM domain